MLESRFLGSEEAVRTTEMRLLRSNTFRENMLPYLTLPSSSFSVCCAVRCPSRSTQRGVTRTRCCLICTLQPSAVLTAPSPSNSSLPLLLFFLFFLSHAHTHTQTQSRTYFLLSSSFSLYLPPPSIPLSILYSWLHESELVFLFYSPKIDPDILLILTTAITPYLRRCVGHLRVRIHLLWWNRTLQL